MNGVMIYRLPGTRRRGGLLSYLFEYLSFLVRAFIKVSVLFLKRRYTIVQVNTLPDFLVFAATVPKFFGVKIILDLQEAMPEFFAAKYRISLKSFLIKLLTLVEVISASFADHVLTIHKTMKSVFMEHGIPDSKITCILNVPDEQIFKPSLARNTLCNDNKSFVCISHGSILERYGYHIGVKAVHALKDKIPGIKLRIVGKGEYLPEVQRLCKELQMGKHVEFIEYRPLEELPRLILESDVGLVPVLKDIYTDLMHANKMFEYIAMHRPVVITRTKAVCDYFDEKSLMFCNSGDVEDFARCILELYNDPQKRQTIASNAFNRYQEICWSVMKQRYLTVIENLYSS